MSIAIVLKMFLTGQPIGVNVNKLNVINMLLKEGEENVFLLSKTQESTQLDRKKIDLEDT